MKIPQQLAFLYLPTNKRLKTVPLFLLVLPMRRCTYMNATWLDVLLTQVSLSDHLASLTIARIYGMKSHGHL